MVWQGLLIVCIVAVGVFLIRAWWARRPTVDPDDRRVRNLAAGAEAQRRRAEHKRQGDSYRGGL